MNVRLITPWKRANSSQYWFRLVVPPRYRAAVGKTEIRQSLGTNDLGEARRQCAARQSDWLRRFDTIECELRAHEARRGIDAVDRYLHRQAAELGGMDRAVAFELEGMALAEAAYLEALSSADFGMAAGEHHPLASETYPGFQTDAVRNVINLRRSTMAPTAAAALPGYEAIDRAAVLHFHALASSAIEEAFTLAGLKVDRTLPEYRIAAEYLFDRLRNHALPGMAMLRSAFPPSPAAVTADLQEPIPPAPSLLATEAASNVAPAAPAAHDDSRTGLRQRILSTAADARTLSQVFDAWTKTQPRSAVKLCDEWRVAIRRFVELFSDRHVAEIDSDMVIDFREAMKRLPTRPKREVGTLPLLEQIDYAREHDLPTLAGATVAKLVSGLRVTLDYACDPLRIIKVNPAVAVRVTGAQSDADARLPFSPEDMQTIFSHPMMTDPVYPGSMTPFWLMMLAPLTGLRIEEMGKLRPHNIRCERGIWYAAVERDGRRKRRAENAEGKASKGAKTRAAYRDVALHRLLIEAGFVDYAQFQKNAGEPWIFPDLKPDKYGARTKAVSRDLIRHLRSLGITEEEKVFHSFRHSMKRACRQTSMKEEIADLLAGHVPDSVGRQYGAGAALDVLRDAVNLIKYETISWDPIIAAAKARYKPQRLS